MNLIQKAIKKAKDFTLYKNKKDRNGTGYNRSRREY